MTPGARFQAALQAENPLQIVGTINAYTALLAKRAGFRAIYLSGAGVANASYGMPDVGRTTLEDVLEDVRRITKATDLPLLVDADTGWERQSTVAHTTREMISAGAAGMHLEDQVESKRCGHLPGKVLVPPDQMRNRIRSAVEARSDPDFIIMARTDACAVEGLSRAIDRSRQYVEAGADMIFAEALGSIEEYRQCTQEVPVPVLANLTEFGKTPPLTLDELRAAGVRMALYPLSAFRAMSRATQTVFETIRSKGTTKEILQIMQTRQELYDVLEYDGLAEK